MNGTSIFLSRNGGAIALLLALAALLLLPRVAFAEECQQAKEVTQPCHGVLLPTAAAAAGLTCLRADLPKEQNEVARLKALAIENERFTKETLQLAEERLLSCDSQLKSCLGVIKPEAWYTSKAFWIPATAILSFGAGVATVVLIEKYRQ